MSLDFMNNLKLIEGNSTSCQGKDSFDSHPKVYLDLSKGDIVICPYCNQKFKKK
tara:strand:- start:134 stop:295 length:162 start_codon:yes stop_codon:yes gene_type:complete